jgi:DNA-binding IclR family transcriptional regulator
MPARHHRTVDRTVAIIEQAARSRDGVTLAELAKTLSAPKSSVQELTNGLLATGYLSEREGRFHLGPATFLLSLHTAGLPLDRVRHDELERAQQRLGRPLFAGTRVGDDHVFFDQVGEEMVTDFVSANHPRRPLLITATGKIILAHLKSAERNEFLGRMQRDQPEVVEAFLAELPGIGATSLAFNRSATLPGRYAVATPLIDPDGTFLAAVCTVGGPEIADRLDEVGQELLDAIRQWSFTRPAGAAR